MAKENSILLFSIICILFQHVRLAYTDEQPYVPTTTDYSIDYSTNVPYVYNELLRKVQNLTVSDANLSNTSNDDVIQLSESRTDSLLDKSSYDILPSTSEQNLAADNEENVTIEFDNVIHSESPIINTEYQINNGQDVPNKDNSIAILGKKLFGDQISTTEGLASKDLVQGLSDHPCKRKCISNEDPMTCFYSFNIEWYYSMSKACFNCSTNASDCYRPDCVSVDGIKRPIIVVNRTLPGPSIEVCLGDRVIVDVHNHLMEESTSIHWHGQHQRGSPYMDGVPFITQCPISPHSMFQYNYLAATPGTHFWHSHSGCQRTDGVVGNMIIRTPPSEDPHYHLYDEDLSEHIINVMDWAHQLGVSMFVAHYHGDGSNKPTSMIVNGKGRFFNDSLSVTTTPLAVFTVKKGLRYRFRLINAGNQNCPIELSIDNHTLTVINSDGGNFQPKEGVALVTYAGERWDFVLNTNSSVRNYWMRFKGLMDCDERFSKVHQVAILRYEGAPEEDPVEPVDYYGPKIKGLVINAMNVRRDDPNSVSIPELVAVDVNNDPNLKKNADHQFYIGYDFYQVDTSNYHKPSLYGFKEAPNNQRVYTPQFNHISMKMPSVPLLSQRDMVSSDMFCDHKALKNCTVEHCECTNVISVPLGDVVELILIDEGNTYNANHPFHLHGHPFRVVGMDRLGNSTTVEYVKNKDRSEPLYRNLKTAPLKDSVTVPDGGYTIIRFHAINPGYWLFHCHLEFHVEVGMALIFKVGEHSQFPPVPVGFPRCGDYVHSESPLDKFTSNIKENEVNFGDDYGFGRNSTRNRKTIDSKTTQFWTLNSLVTSGASNVLTRDVLRNQFYSLLLIVFYSLCSLT